MCGGQPGWVDLSRYLLDDGHRARAYGRVVAIADGTWFEPPSPMALIGHRPGYEPAPRPPSHLAVRVAGVDLARLHLRREKDGAVEGYAVLAGIWRVEELVVTAQEPSTEPEAGPRWRDPPCREPDGGWPEGPERENLDLPEELASMLPIVSTCLFRPSSRQVVLVVAAELPEQVEKALRPYFGSRLCVIPSRWTGRQVEDMVTTLRVRMGEWSIYGYGKSVGEDGQPAVVAQVIRVQPALVSWALDVPDGLLLLQPWLAPIRDRQQ